MRDAPPAAFREALLREDVPRTSTAPTTLRPEHLADPDSGHASDLARPGGFRRAHVLSRLPEGAGAAEHATRRLVVSLEQRGFNERFVTRVVQTFDDGTKIYYDSRSYRRGRVPIVERTDSTVSKWLDASADGTPNAKRACGCLRPYSLSFWVSVLFFVGSLLFVVGSVLWMIPEIGDTFHGAISSPNEASFFPASGSAAMSERAILLWYCA